MFNSYVSLPEGIISIYTYINPTIVGDISIKIQIDPIQNKTSNQSSTRFSVTSIPI
jgi:hypothetical protein